MAQVAYQVTDEFTKRIGSVFAGGTEWLARLPELLETYARRWKLTILPPYTLSYNYVAPAIRQDGTPAVIKMGVPHPELTSEIAALQFYDGRGAVRLYEAEPEQGAFLMERLQPGKPLSMLTDDNQATEIAAGVMRRLWQPARENGIFITVAGWGQGFQDLHARFTGGCGPFPIRLVERAESLHAELLASTTDQVLLHGDLHHDNIVLAERPGETGTEMLWLALDPKGVVGDPAYEAASFMWNPIPMIYDMPDLAQLIRRRLLLFAEQLGLDYQRLLGWTIAKSVLSAWWDYADHQPYWQQMLALTEKLLTL